MGASFIPTGSPSPHRDCLLNQKSERGAEADNGEEIGGQEERLLLLKSDLIQRQNFLYLFRFLDDSTETVAYRQCRNGASEVPPKPEDLITGENPETEIQQDAR